MELMKKYQVYIKNLKRNKMTPKEKAEELVERYDETLTYLESKSKAKQCALIAVDEIIKSIDFDWMEVQNLESQHRYWQEVKQEIEKL